jgi:hypothetical protein
VSESSVFLFFVGVSLRSPGSTTFRLSMAHISHFLFRLSSIIATSFTLWSGKGLTTHCAKRDLICVYCLRLYSEHGNEGDELKKQD